MAFQASLLCSRASGLLLLLPLIMLTPTSVDSLQGLSGCPTRCGDVEVPYPFGFLDGCYRDEAFQLTCNHTHFNPPLLFRGNINITNISLAEGLVDVSLYIGRDCYDQNGTALNSGIMSTALSGSAFTMSTEHNRFTVTGCDTQAYIVDPAEKDGFWTGCASMCKSLDAVDNSTCSGVGCCQTSIPKGLKYYQAEFRTFFRHTRVWNFNPCSLAFVVDHKKFEFNFTFLKTDYTYDPMKLPAVFDWAIEGDTDCRKAMENTSYACLSQNSECFPSPNELGYLCKCSSGYQGNPYLVHGCQDIDECQDSIAYPCNGLCKNLLGGYNCSCPPDSYAQDPTKDKCIPSPANQKFPLSLKLVIGLGSSLFFLLIMASWIYWGFQKRRLMQLRQRFFEQNGGLFLQQQISSDHQGTNFRIFTQAELARATNNFDKDSILGRGGHGIVYKGILDDNRMAAVKRSMMVDEHRSKEFAKEMHILSKINHKNVVKLFGCCLEVEVPILVYEYVANGTLFHHIHEKKFEHLMSLDDRLKVAAEAAEALSYLHSAASPPILHGDVKPSNILLDSSYTVKVSDFGTSTLAPNDKAQFTTLVQGTCGYLDPEYLQTAKLTEKSDVYSFGVILVELLTGKKALYFGGSEEEISTALNFISCMNENRLHDILDPRVVNEGSFEQLQQVAELATQCLSMKGEERPTMREVLMELETMRRSGQHPWIGHDPEEAESLLGEPLESDPNNNTTGYFSLETHIAVNVENGR